MGSFGRSGGDLLILLRLLLLSFFLFPLLSSLFSGPALAAVATSWCASPFSLLALAGLSDSRVFTAPTFPFHRLFLPVFFSLNSYRISHRVLLAFLGLHALESGPIESKQLETRCDRLIAIA